MCEINDTLSRFQQGFLFTMERERMKMWQQCYTVLVDEQHYPADRAAEFFGGLTVRYRSYLEGREHVELLGMARRLFMEHFKEEGWANDDGMEDMEDMVEMMVKENPHVSASFSRGGGDKDLQKQRRRNSTMERRGFRFLQALDTQIMMIEAGERCQAGRGFVLLPTVFHNVAIHNGGACPSWKPMW